MLDVDLSDTPQSLEVEIYNKNTSLNEAIKELENTEASTEELEQNTLFLKETVPLEVQKDVVSLELYRGYLDNIETNDILVTELNARVSGLHKAIAAHKEAIASLEAKNRHLEEAGRKVLYLDNFRSKA
jgi:exonuclease VII small subunit